MGSASWVPLDVNGGPDEPWANADPAEALTALLEAYERPAWHAEAACRGMGPDLFFPARGQSTAEAKALCDRCPVPAECLTAGLGEKHGIWGGSTEAGRRLLRHDSGAGSLQSAKAVMSGQVPPPLPARRDAREVREQHARRCDYLRPFADGEHG